MSAPKPIYAWPYAPCSRKPRSGFGMCQHEDCRQRRDEAAAKAAANAAARGNPVPPKSRYRAFGGSGT